MANRSPQETAEFITEFSNTKAFPELTKDLLGRWAKIDPLAATEFMTGLGPGEARDATFETAANSFIRRDPIVALEWAAAIGDDNREARIAVAGRIIDEGYAVTPKEKAAMIDQSPLTSEDRAALKNTLNPPQAGQ
jgi:hypothetical protein